MVLSHIWDSLVSHIVFLFYKFLNCFIYLDTLRLDYTNGCIVPQVATALAVAALADIAIASGGFVAHPCVDMFGEVTHGG
jgi:hypothetical protein